MKIYIFSSLLAFAYTAQAVTYAGNSVGGGSVLGRGHIEFLNKREPGEYAGIVRSSHVVELLDGHHEATTNGRGAYNKIVTEPLEERREVATNGRGAYNRIATEPVEKRHEASTNGRGAYNKIVEPVEKRHEETTDGRGAYNKISLEE